MASGGADTASGSDTSGATSSDREGDQAEFRGSESKCQIAKCGHADSGKDLTMRMFLLLVAVAVASALGVVHMKYRTRLLFSEIQRLQQINEAYDESLAQLQFEQNRWAERERIERQARDHLGMDLPDPSNMISIKP